MKIIKQDFTDDQLNKCWEWCDNKNVKYKCKDDNWCPTSEDVEQIEDMYREAEINYKEYPREASSQMKLILIFVMWIIYTGEDLNPYVERKLNKFLKERIAVIGED